MTDPGSLVLDASAMVELLWGTEAGDRVARLARGKALHAPDLLDVEVLNAFKRLERAGHVQSGDAERFVAGLQAAPVRRHSARGLTPSAWAIRDRCSIYDAMYVSLAAALDCPVVTTDGRWQRADLGVSVLTVT